MTSKTAKWSVINTQFLTMVPTMSLGKVPFYLQVPKEKYSLPVLHGTSLKILQASPQGCTLKHVIFGNTFLGNPENPTDILRALGIYYWERGLPCECPIPTPQTGITYLRRQFLSRKLARSEMFNISCITNRMRNALRWAFSAGNQKGEQRGDAGAEDHTQVQLHHCRSSPKGALPFLLADPPLASEERAPMPVTSDFSNIR